MAGGLRPPSLRTIRTRRKGNADPRRLRHQRPRRLARIARICEDYGVRVQYSLFECRLEETELEDFWLKLLGEINEKEDRLVAYKIDARSAKETLTAGTMVCSEKVVCYVV